MLLQLNQRGIHGAARLFAGHNVRTNLLSILHGRLQGQEYVQVCSQAITYIEVKSVQFTNTQMLREPRERRVMSYQTHHSNMPDIARESWHYAPKRSTDIITSKPD